MNQAERASAVIEEVYAEALNSKLRLSKNNTENGFFSKRLEKIDPLPTEILVKMLQLEDLFELSYQLYGYGSDYAGTYGKDGIKASDELKEIIELKYDKKELDRRQIKFLEGILELRIGDFLYFIANSTSDPKRKSEIACESIKHYEKTLEILFNIRNAHFPKNPKSMDQEEQQCIAYLANNIGSAYLLFVLPESVDLNYVKKLEKTALLYSEYMDPKVREFFARNLGVAYDRKGDISAALDYYIQAYKLNPGSSKAVHCIGAIYRNMIKEKYRWLFENAFLIHPEEKMISPEGNALSPEESKEITDTLIKSCYWFRLKQFKNGGEVDKNLETINRILYNITKDDKYLHEVQRYRNEEEIVNSLLETGKPKEEQQKRIKNRK